MRYSCSWRRLRSVALTIRMPPKLLSRPRLHRKERVDLHRQPQLSHSNCNRDPISLAFWMDIASWMKTWSMQLRSNSRLISKSTQMTYLVNLLSVKYCSSTTRSRENCSNLKTTLSGNFHKSWRKSTTFTKRSLTRKRGTRWTNGPSSSTDMQVNWKSMNLSVLSVARVCLRLISTLIVQKIVRPRNSKIRKQFLFSSQKKNLPPQSTESADIFLQSRHREGLRLETMHLTNSIQVSR